MSSRQKTKQLLVGLGFTSKEIQAVEELAAKKDTNVRQIIRMSLRVYQAQDAGLLEWKEEATGRPVID